MRLRAHQFVFGCCRSAYGVPRHFAARSTTAASQYADDRGFQGADISNRLTGPTSVFTDTAVGQFSLDTTNVTSSILLSRELKSPGSVEGPNYVSDSRGRAGKR